MRSRIFRCLGYVVAALAAVALMGVPALKSIDDRADQSSTAARAEAAQPAAATVDPPRPAALVPLYLTFAGLQALDIHSTMLALQGGGPPLLGGPPRRPGWGGGVAVSPPFPAAVIMAGRRVAGGPTPPPQPQPRAERSLMFVSLRSAYEPARLVRVKPVPMPPLTAE